MTDVIKIGLAALLASAAIGFTASSAVARTHHHHHHAKVSSAAAPATHGRHRHKHGSAHASKHGAAHASAHGRRGKHKRVEPEIVPHPHERHAALCQTVTVHHRSVERCRG
jgi:hypothetical protein